MKVTISPVGSLIDATTAANTINADLTAIQTAMENTLSRDGTAPNTMNASLDMNSNRILNLPSAASGLEPVRFQDLTFTGTQANLGTMGLQNANAVAITGGTISGGSIGTAVTGVTQAPGDNTTKLATTAFVVANTSGVSSVGTKTGAITVRGGALPANELTVPRFDAAQTLSAGEIAQHLTNTGTVGYTAAQTITLAQQKQTRANLGGPAAEMYTQVGTSAVTAPLITRLNNTIYASEFGAVGDNATNDYAALQAFLNAVVSQGKEGRFDPGKKYFVSGNDLFLNPNISGAGNVYLWGNGAQIRTDPTQARIGLKIQKTNILLRQDETIKVVVEGLRLNQYQDANAAWGFNIIGSTFVTLRDCTVICGSDNATVPYVNYAAYYFSLSNPVDPNTGSFWCTVDNCAVKGAVTPSPNGLRIDGQCNAMKILNTTFANCTEGILFARASLGLNNNEAGLANGVRIDSCDFEGGVDAIGFVGTPGWSTCPGLTITNCRAESLTNFFNYSLNTNPGTNPPVLGFNYSTATNLITNPNSLTVKQVTIA